MPVKNSSANNDKGEDILPVAIVGAGLVGCLQTCYLAKRGIQIHLFEKLPDIRKMEHVPGRSINLAMSCRGRAALDRLGLEKEFIQYGIPMDGRMIHDIDGTTRAIPYGRADQHLLSVDRRKLNEMLLTEAEKYPNVRVFYEHKLIGCDIKKKRLTYKNKDDKEVTYPVSLIIGADGAYSAVRQEIQKRAKMSFSQLYTEHRYLEVPIPPCINGQGFGNGSRWPMAVNYLHIWPRNEFMMIGLPNQDGSFTGTLFMPADEFKNSLDTPEHALEFFQRVFPDSLAVIPTEELLDTVQNCRPLPMVSVKCDPFHYMTNAVLIGDAAHAMVPFYGQGMNAGMEDCLLFDQLMDEFNDDLELVLPEFSKRRCDDAHAICDLAFSNYTEMKSSVNKVSFLLRKKVDNFLHYFFPNTWVPLYTTVSFTRTSYRKCIENRQWQDKVLSRLGMCLLVATSVVALRLIRNPPPPPRSPEGVLTRSCQYLPSAGSVASGVTGAASGVVSAVGGATSGVVSAVGKVTPGVVSAVGGATSGVVSAAGGAVSGLGSGLSWTGGKIASLFGY